MIKEIMNTMETIEYGFKDINGNNIIDSKSFNKEYYLQTPNELLESKYGICWDQVELERYLFNKYNINNKTYFIFLKNNTTIPSHTFLTYQDNNKYYWFEHSWNKYKGIHEYNSIKELLNDINIKFIQEYGNYKTYIYEYNKPNYHITCNEFYKYIETQKYIDINSNC